MRLKRGLNVSAKIMAVQYKDRINVKNIESLSRFKINRILKNEDKEDREVFLHNLLDAWIKNFKGTDGELFSKIKKLIRKTKIKLNDIERDALLILEERAFSEIRHIKIIDVTHDMNRGETVGIKYERTKLYVDGKNIHEGDLLISNQRIMLNNFEKEFYFENIEYFEDTFNGLKFKIRRGKEYMLRIYDNKTLSNTLKNLISKKIKNPPKFI